MPRDTHRRGDPRGRPSRDPRGRPSRDPRGRPSRDPCGRPSRIQHGFVSFVRGGVPRPCGVPYRPERGHGETGMGDDKRRPYTRTARRRGPRRGDPRGRPSRDPCGRPSRIRHGFVSFVRGGVPRPCGVPYRPERGHGETGMGDDKRRPYTRTARRRGPRRGDPRGRPSRDPCGRPSRIQHGFVSFVRGGVPRPCGVRTDPNEAIGKPGMGDDKRRPYTRTARRRGPRRGDPRGRPSRIQHASFPSYEVACHALVASRTDPNEAMGKPAWATTSVAPRVPGMGMN